jgi:hypothetical protein
MGVRIRYTTADGTTVPYPSLFDEIRHNYGFIDTRGRPERVAEIPEARESLALKALLTRLAQPGACLVSLGCDLGHHDEPKSRFEARRVAGGYVQIVAGQEQGNDLDFLRSVAKLIDQGLRATVGVDLWEVQLQLSPVLLKFKQELETQSIWVWFFAKSSTDERAVASRERVIESIEQSIATLEG